MKNKIKFIIGLFSITGFLNLMCKPAPALNQTSETDFYQFKIKTIEGIEYNLSQLKGKKILCVNVASYCGYTYQYEGLQELSEKYKDKLVVLGFPCNQFGGQEPDSAETIQKFCTSKYHVSFPIMEKIDVKGKNQHPIYQWLTQKSLNGLNDFEVKWNFNKFLINEEGKLIQYFSSKVKPMDSLITDYLK